MPGYPISRESRITSYNVCYTKLLRLERYTAFGYPVVPDLQQDYAGPLAGMASALQRTRTPYLLTAPCDSPLLPRDLALRLYRRLRAEEAQVCAAHDGVRNNFV